MEVITVIPYLRSILDDLTNIPTVCPIDMVTAGRPPNIYVFDQYHPAQEHLSDTDVDPKTYSGPVNRVFIKKNGWKQGVPIKHYLKLRTQNFADRNKPQNGIQTKWVFALYPNSN